MATTATLVNERTDRHGTESRETRDRGPATAVAKRVAAPAREKRRSRPGSPRRSSGLIPCQIGGGTWHLAERPYHEEGRADAVFRFRLALVVLSLGIGLLFFLLFGVDLVAAWPFHRHSVEMDVAYLFCGAALMYLSWETSRDLR